MSFTRGSGTLKLEMTWPKTAGTNNKVHRILRERYSPTIYAIVLKNGSFPFKAKDENTKDGTEEQRKLCKVGITQDFEEHEIIEY